jgi:hypothetical protein
MSSISNSFESVFNLVDNQINSLYNNHINEHYNSNFNNTINEHRIIDRIVRNNGMQNDTMGNSLNYIDNNSDNRNNTISDIHNNIHNYINNNGNINQLSNIINNFVNTNIRNQNNSNYNRNNSNYNSNNSNIENDHSANDMNNYNQILNNSLQEEEHDYHGRDLNSIDSNNINVLYRIRGVIGECNICCDETKKVCRCHTCTFQYCQDCLSRVITDFNKCSSCNQNLNISELKKIENSNSDTIIENNIENNNNIHSNQQTNRINIRNTGNNRHNCMDNRHNCMNTKKIEYLHFLDYIDNNTGETIKVYTKTVNNHKYTYFESSDNQKPNIELDVTIFNNEILVHIYSLLIHRKIHWNHFRQLYNNNYSIIKNDIYKRNEFINILLNYLVS